MAVVRKISYIQGMQFFSRMSTSLLRAVSQIEQTLSAIDATLDTPLYPHLRDIQIERGDLLPLDAPNEYLLHISGTQLEAHIAIVQHSTPPSVLAFGIDLYGVMPRAHVRPHRHY